MAGAIATTRAKELVITEQSDTDLVSQCTSIRDNFSDECHIIYWKENGCWRYSLKQSNDIPFKKSLLKYFRQLSFLYRIHRHKDVEYTLTWMVLILTIV